jgi:hypothetical protein
MAGLEPDDEVANSDRCADDVEENESPQAVMKVDAKEEWHRGDVQEPPPPEFLADDPHAGKHQDAGDPSENLKPVVDEKQM